MAVMSFVVAVSLVFTTTAYAQENKTMMDKEHKYFVVQDTKSSVPDNLAKGHIQKKSNNENFEFVIIIRLIYLREYVIICRVLVIFKR